jgi:hexosaminidase
VIPFLVASVLPSISAPMIIPAPAKMIVSGGAFRMSDSTTISAPARLLPLANRLRDLIGPTTGFKLPPSPSGTIALRLNSRNTLGREGYRLTVTPGGVEIAANSEVGIFYGIQTLLQLLPTEVYSPKRVSRVQWDIPCVNIEDAPRFAWRGSHMDVGRHFMPKEFIFKHLDTMAMHKLNVFHWHLTEDQGWRIEILKYPRLTDVGAWRNGPNGRYGGYYSQSDVREIVKYAADRFITIVPEIEMPGHCQAAIAAYPELGNSGDRLDVGVDWGVYSNVFNVKDSTITFLQNVLDEVIGLFPGKFIHIGGDEVPKTQWADSAFAQAKIRKLGLKNEQELQSWFIKQMASFISSRGRRLVGWDEILEGGLAEGAVVMSWRGVDGGIAAAKAGHDVVMAPTEFTYFDYYQSEDWSKEPKAIGGFVPLHKVYQFEPVPKELLPEEAKRILGAQGQLWSEYISTPEQMEYMGYPRLCALSEVLWSPREERSYEDFVVRLRAHLKRLDYLKVNYRPMDGGKS